MTALAVKSYRTPCGVSVAVNAAGRVRPLTQCCGSVAMSAGYGLPMCPACGSTVGAEHLLALDSYLAQHGCRHAGECAEHAAWALTEVE